MEKARTSIIEMLKNRKEKIRFAIQKDGGRSNEYAWGLLTACVEAAGGKMPERKERDRRAILKVESLPGVEIVPLRNYEIPLWVQNGKANLGIVGEDQVLEAKARVKTLARLGEGKCSLQAYVPMESSIQSVKDLKGKNIATSFLNLTNDFLKSQNIRPKSVTKLKSIEAAVKKDEEETEKEKIVYDAGFDIVETGESMRVNNLRSIGIIKNFETILITN